MDPAKVLVVEDNADNLALVRFLLERAEYQVFSTDNGVDAIRLAHELRPDLIILDMAIPELDGWTAAKEMKTDPEICEIPIVALTAFTMPVDRKRAMDAGCDGFIPKPMNISEFVNEVKGFLEPKPKKTD